MSRLYLDIETFCQVDINRLGLYPYARHPSMGVTVIAWAIDDAPVQTWSYEAGHPPNEFIWALSSPTIEKWAHNAQFERVVLGQWLNGEPLDPHGWRCSEVLARRLELPASLSKLTKALRGPVKLDEDKSLLKLFATPPGGPDHTHERWQDWVDYCQRDVEAMRYCIETMHKAPGLREPKKLPMAV